MTLADIEQEIIQPVVTNIPVNKSLFWVQTEALENVLDSRTWLDVTAELRHLGWDVILISAGDDGETVIQDVPVLQIHKPDVYLISQVLFHWAVLGRLFRDWNSLDVVLFHEMSAIWMLFASFINIFRKHKLRFVMDVRTLPMINNQNRTFKDIIRDAYYGMIHKTIRFWVDGQLAITPRMAQAVGIPSEQLLGVWASGVTAESFQDGRENRDWARINDEVRLVYIGSLAKERNLVPLCHAILAAREEGLRFSMHLVGSGSAQDELKQIAASSNDVITIDDPVNHTEIPNILAKSHLGVLVFPDELRFQVSSPIKLFEYMASGMPIFASHIACHTDVVGDDDFAVWVHDTSIDGLLQGLRHAWDIRQTLPRMGEIAYDAVDNWTWQASAKKLSQALLTALKTRKTND